MKKKDIKNGMIVEHRNGWRRLFVNGFLLDGDYDYDYENDITNYRYDLTHKKAVDFDIMEVYDWQNNLLWRRKELLTKDENVILRNLPEEYKWIARDESNYLFIYNTKPSKRDGNWNNEDGDYINFNEFNHLFTLIKWVDEEPYYIPDLLEKKND